MDCKNKLPTCCSHFSHLLLFNQGVLSGWQVVVRSSQDGPSTFVSFLSANQDVDVHKSICCFQRTRWDWRLPVCLLLEHDECLSGLHNCDENALCFNMVGGHSCSCKPGYTGNGTVCKGTLPLYLFVFTLPRVTSIHDSSALSKKKCLFFWSW